MTSGFWKLFWESWELFSARHEHSISVPDSMYIPKSLPPSSYIGTTLQPRIRTPKMQASPSTRQPSKDILLIKCLELGVVIGVAMACCSVTNISHLRHPLVPRCSVTKNDYV